MKILSMLLTAMLMLTFSFSKGQYFQSENPSISATFGAGTSSYFGDLVEKNKFMRQPSYSFSGGFSYNHNQHFNLRLEFAISKIQASDSKNKRADLKARNLNFKSNIFDANFIVDYNLLAMTESRKFTPYVFLGVGFCHFNPYTTDRSGNKVFLQPLGTEGQGLSAYPDRKPYSRTAAQMPFGVGIKYALSSRLLLQLEYKYRYVVSDYLDDVSNAGYPNQTILAVGNPNLPLLTYRGDELPGGASYPKGSGLNRGNPNNRDSYYSLQFKIAYTLSKKGIEINY